MRQFEIVMENKIGSMAELCDALAKAKINIRAIATDGKDTLGIIRLVTDDEELTRQALKAAGLDFSEYEMLPIKLIDRPGELAKLTRAMSNMKIDIESVFLLGRDQGTTEMAFKVNNLQGAKNLLT